MNAFFIPRLGTQIYTMAGMQTQLSLMADRTGTFEGISSNFSGNGFTDMHFAARSMTKAQFAAWVAKVRASHRDLSLTAYRELAKPSARVPVEYYAQVAPSLFHDILNLCTDGQRCIDANDKMSARAMPAMPGMATTARRHAAGS
jgi:cytochrome o ubiquinol oxidase subunit 2